MHMSKKFLCLLLSTGILIGAAACGGTAGGTSSADQPQSSPQAASQEAQEDAKKGTFPIVAEPIHVTAMGVLSPQGGDHNDTYCWTEYEKMTNVVIEWENIPGDVREERLSVALASNKIPDMMYGMGLSTSDVVKYGGYGVFMQLEDLVADYGIHFQAVMKEYPDVKKSITMPDGHIYSLPKMNSGILMRNNMHFINPNWLKNVGKEMPENLNEFTDVLKAFRDKDANGNGDPNDEIPLAFRTSHLIKTMQTYFGLGTRGSQHAYVDVDEKNNLRFMPIQPQYKDMLVYLNMLYSEKLLDNEVFTMPSSRDMVAKLTTDVVGSHADFSTNCGPEMQEVFKVIPLMDNFYGEKTWTRTEPVVGGVGAFLLSNETKYAKELMQWADYFFSEEGQIMYNLGIEGVTYEKTPEGDYKYTDLLLKNPDGLTLTQVRSKYMGFQGAVGIQSDKYYKGAETFWTSQEGMPFYKDYVSENIWPEFPMTGEESEEFSALLSDIKSYSDEMFAAFVTGKKPIGDWDKYVAEYEKLSLTKFMEMYKSLSDRYESN